MRLAFIPLGNNTRVPRFKAVLTIEYNGSLLPSVSEQRLVLSSC